MKIIMAHGVQTRATSKLTSVGDTRDGIPDSDGNGNSISAENDDSQDWWRHLANVDISDNETEFDTEPWTAKSDFALAQRTDKLWRRYGLERSVAAMDRLSLTDCCTSARTRPIVRMNSNRFCQQSIEISC